MVYRWDVEIPHLPSLVFRFFWMTDITLIKKTLVYFNNGQFSFTKFVSFQFFSIFALKWTEFDKFNPLFLQKKSHQTRRMAQIGIATCFLTRLISLCICMAPFTTGRLSSWNKRPYGTKHLTYLLLVQATAFTSSRTQIIKAFSWMWSFYFSLIFLFLLIWRIILR